MRRKLVWAAALLLVGVGVYGGVAVATPSQGVSNPSWSPVLGRFEGGIDARTKTDVDPGTATDYWKFDLDAKGATDVQVIENLVAPGGSFGWHTHPGPSLVIVRSGLLTVYHGSDCTHPEQYGPGSPLGSTFVDQGHDLHLVRNNGTVAVDSYVVSFLPAGFGRRIDAPNPDPSVCTN
jgi:hypothetical protein